jgi:GT2 family glycosyltransferase/2-polyprenyl-3-methyl-5-hydroxy-6-metoxy-1,4-benzoquinol methylase
MNGNQEHENGYCVVCGSHSSFRFDSTIISPQLQKAWNISDDVVEAFNCKESMFCSCCGCSLRIRRLAAVLIQTFLEIGGTPCKSFVELLRNEEFRCLKIAEINACGTLHSYLKDHPNLYYSEWVPHAKPGELHAGVRCEDLQCLTYPDSYFDIILTSETLEHVPDPDRAWLEINRTLKGGGFHIFTIPIVPWQRETIKRARVVGGRREDLLEPAYHSPWGREDVFVYTDFGMDVVEKLNAIGLNTEVFYLSPETDLDVAMVFRSHKTGGYVEVGAQGVSPLLEWTGERYLPWLEEAAIGYEHLHRYAYATQFVQNKRVLDLACGEGYGSCLLARTAESVVGIDIDKRAIKHARNKYIKQNLDFQIGSITQIPITGTHLFDVAVCFEALEHIEEHQKLLSEVKRLLTPNGIFIVSTPNKKVYTDEPQFNNPFHVHELYFDEFRELFEKYFKHVQFLGQRIYCNSNIWPVFSGADNKVVEYVIDRNPKEFVFVENDKRIPLYFIAIACDTDCGIEETGSALIDVSDALIKQKDGQIAAHTKEQDRLTTDIGQLSATVQAQQQALAQRDEQASHLIGERERFVRDVTELQSALSSHKQALLEKEENASALTQDRDRVARDVIELQAAVQAQQETLAKHSEETRQLMVERECLAQQTVQLHALINGYRQALEEREEEAKRIGADQERLGRETQELQAAINNGQKELSNMEELILQRNAALNNIYSSHGWKILMAYYRLRNKVLPEGTRRRAAAKFLWRSICDSSGVSAKHDQTAVAASVSEIKRGGQEIAAFELGLQALLVKTTTKFYRKLPLSQDQRAFLKDQVYRYFFFVFHNTESYRVWRQLQQQSTIKQSMIPALFGSLTDSPSFNHQCGGQSNICNVHSHHQYTPEQKKGSFDDLPNVDVSLVTYNSAKWIRPFFQSLVKQSYPVQFIKVFITDHGSQDETVDVLSKLAVELGGQFGSFQINNRSNRGFGSGHNFNFKQGNSPYFLVSNVDLELEPDAVEAVVAAGEADEESVASWEFRQKPHEHPKYYDPISLETAWSSHACVLLRRTALENVGGYDETIFMYGEDVELSFRLRDNGYQLKYCPRAVAWHFTYDYPDQVKPLQFSESILNHAYIRLRYGRLSEILAIPPMYGRLLLCQPTIPRQRIVVLKNALKIARNGLHFLATRKRSKTRFMFYNWDYELRRDGAFYKYRRGRADDLPLVSVIMRTFAGRGEWLKQAVSSVINQTYPKLELVVVEDGSDTAEAFITKLRQKTNIKIIYKTCEKRGRCHAGNVGLSLSTGTFLSFLDDDDAIMADHIEVLVDELLAHPESAAVYSLSWEVETKAFHSPEFSYADVNFWTPPHLRQPFSREVISHHNYIPIQTLLFRRALYESYGGLDESMEYLEDWNLWVRYSSEQEFLFVEKTTSLFRTPHEPEARDKRHQLLHAYYTVAREKNAIALGKIGNASSNKSDSWIEENRLFSDE